MGPRDNLQKWEKILLNYTSDKELKWLNSKAVLTVATKTQMNSSVKSV